MRLGCEVRLWRGDVAWAGGVRLCGETQPFGTTAVSGCPRQPHITPPGNLEVISALADSGALIREEAHRHKYPYDWRTKKPTIVRATSQCAALP